jgi:hypothetical protein
MLNVKQATAKAFEYFAELYGDDSRGLRLEEVELTDDGRNWLITLSYQSGSGLALLLKDDPSREYKVFKINANTGQVQSMKIRKVG